MQKQTLPFSIKSITDSGVVEGVISAFGGVDGHGDTIARGAYTKSLARLETSGRMLPMLYQHDRARPIGVWTELRQSDHALIGRPELAMEVRDAQEAHALARKGPLTGISIGFEIAEGGSKREANRRVLTAIDLWEASLVTFPSDPHARVTSVKSIGAPSDIEDMFREAGMSGRKAKVAASAAWKAINQSDNEPQADAELVALIRASTARLSTGN